MVCGKQFDDGWLVSLDHSQTYFKPMASFIKQFRSLGMTVEIVSEEQFEFSGPYEKANKILNDVEEIVFDAPLLRGHISLPTASRGAMLRDAFSELLLSFRGRMDICSTHFPRSHAVFHLRLGGGEFESVKRYRHRSLIALIEHSDILVPWVVNRLIKKLEVNELLVLTDTPGFSVLANSGGVTVINSSAGRQNHWKMPASDSSTLNDFYVLTHAARIIHTGSTFAILAANLGGVQCDSWRKTDYLSFVVIRVLSLIRIKFIARRS